MLTLSLSSLLFHNTGSFSHSKKTKNPWIANKYMKRHSTPPTIMECKLKTVVRCYYLPIITATIKINDTNVGQDMEKFPHYVFLVGL